MHDLRTSPRPRAAAVWLLLPLLLVIALSTRANAQDDVTPDATEADQTDVSDALLLRGAEVYTESCSACHQPGGVGLGDQFPPLLNNPAVEVSVYMETVIADGLEGEIEVAGVVYDGRMPSQSTLPAEDIAAVIAYVQSGFAQPVVRATAPGLDLTGGGGFNYTGGTALLIYSAVLAVAVGLFSVRIAGVNDRLTMSWVDAGLKTGVIVVWFILFTVLIPSWALQSQTVSKWDRNIQDLVGVGLWAGGVSIGLWGLWYAQRTKRV